MPLVDTWFCLSPPATRIPNLAVILLATSASAVPKQCVRSAHCVLYIQCIPSCVPMCKCNLPFFSLEIHVEEVYPQTGRDGPNRDDRHGSAGLRRSGRGGRGRVGSDGLSRASRANTSITSAFE